MKANKEIIADILPARKSKIYGVYMGLLDEFGHPNEGESVGLVYEREDQKKFRLKLFMFPNQSYFISADKEYPSHFAVLSMEEYTDAKGEAKTYWNKVGSGKLEFGNLQFSLQLFPTLNFYIPLFPEENKNLNQAHAA